MIFIEFQVNKKILYSELAKRTITTICNKSRRNWISKKSSRTKIFDREMLN